MTMDGSLDRAALGAFVHRIEPGGADRPPVLALHGTGGDENDLLPLAAAVAPGASVLSPRGPVLENGMPRFFRRFAEGRFDHDDVRARADALAAFLAAARAAYGLAKPVALGFSNGANIAAALLYRHPEALAGAVLLRAMTPLPEAPAKAPAAVPVLVVSGALDPIIPPGDAEGLASALAAAGHRLTHRTLPTGHGLVRGDLDAAGAFYAALGASAAAG
jgi:phospholipase/carboxylesterase